MKELKFELPNITKRTNVYVGVCDWRTYYTRSDIIMSMKNKELVSELRPKDSDYKSITMHTGGMPSVGNPAKIDMQADYQRPFKLPYDITYRDIDVTFYAHPTGVEDVNEREVYICGVTGKPFIIFQQKGDATMFSTFSFRAPTWVTEEDVDFHNEIYRRFYSREK
ncbi:MAG TPA: hypothetical protein VIR26_07725 [Metalysinibacillus sp.]